MTMLTLGQAARLTGLGKTTLSRNIKAGRLSATRDETGRYSIDASELARVYPFPAPGMTDATGEAPGLMVRQATPNATSAALAGEVAVLREMLSMMREQLDDTRHDRNAWRDQAQQLALPQPDEKPMSWWRWLRTTG